MSLPRQFLRFASVGAAGTLIQYGFLWAGVRILVIPAAVASGIGYAFGSIFNYILNYFFTFESGKTHTEAASKYYLVLSVGWCINTGFMVIFVHHYGLNYWLSQLVATGIGLVWNFSGSRWWVFKQTQA